MKKKSHSLFAITCFLAFLIIACNKNGKHEEPAPPPIVKEAHLGDTVRIEFPKGSIQSTSVSLKATSITKDNIDVTTAMFDISNVLAYQLVVNIGKDSPKSDSILVKFKLPDNFVQKRKSDEGFQLFAQLYEDGGEGRLDYFTLVNSSYNANEKTIYAYLLADYFTKERNADGTYEVVFTAGITPRENEPFNSTSLKRNSLAANNQINATASPCQVTQISCPLGKAGDCVVTSAFAPSRIHPIAGQPRTHRGTDFRASDGTPVLAVGDGVVMATKYSATVENGKTLGWGNYILIQHASYISIYAHLSDNKLLKEGAQVKRGQLIGKSGHSGGADAPHLHLELIPGKVFAKGAQRDPVPCISDGNIDGNITVRDNGSLADDAFELYIGNTLLGATNIGASNSIAVFNLMPGRKNLSLKCIVAPDNVGTYEVILNNGLTFSSGGVRKEGTIGQGQSATWEIIIPQTLNKTNNQSLRKTNAIKEH